jgi:hypothetical protein
LLSQRFFLGYFRLKNDFKQILIYYLDAKVLTAVEISALKVRVFGRK